MSTRQTRRTRRTAVVDSDDEISNASASKIQTEEGDESIDEPQPPKRQTRARKTAAPAAAPSTTTATRARGRPKRTPAPAASVEPEAESEPSQMSETPDEPENSVIKQEEEEVEDVTQIPAQAPASSPQIKRRSAGPRASIASTTSSATADVTPPSPEADGATVKFKEPSSPLADITASSVNMTTQIPGDIKSPTKTIKPMENMGERPIDIVLKSRTMTVPMVEDTTPKSRIVITHLILDNFKSYAGRQEVGPFHASFSSVVGPNGSGKSNVIDSLLFVFGFRASKMRQGKISALIHNSAQYPNLEFCEVAVHFQEVMDQVSLNP